MCAEPVPAPGYLQALVAGVPGDDAAALLAPWLRKDAAEGLRNRVLNAMEAGSRALAAGYLEHAELLLAEAQRQIETIYADNPAAQAARSKFVPEATKDFKGDPYERAMVGYYLGLIDLSKGDFDNARAGFRFAQLQDTMSASEEYQDDMAVMAYLVGWTYWCEGRTSNAQEEFARAQAIRPQLKAPQKGQNLLLIAEFGNAPQKSSSGAYGELLSYKPGADSPVHQAAFALGPQQIAATEAEDVYFQASTRGGSVVETIRAGKASFRHDADAVSDTSAALAKGAVQGAALTAAAGKKQATKTMLGVAVGAGLVSAVSGKIADATQTAADTRAWSSLPAEIHLATATRVAGAAPVAGFFGVDGQPLYGQAMVAGGNAVCGIAYARHQSGAVSLAGGPAWKALPALASAPKPVQRASPTLPTISNEGEALLDMVRQTRDGK
ncbi:hypothetical protein [Massilia terrae]|uniref:Tetratricopeptide repeat protein n=1 Tax=Massilia terrae TaxID=1811224 RepID=A0ABT2D3Q8_9BURK|nr:hypothetical protein [Massilia terrae]MCS0659963.1 hypothetical protein [Massilia terrae]